jgi:CBS domain containing-hemolysin-like protein
MDEILGIIHVKELFWQWRVLGDQTDLVSLAHAALFFGPQTRLPLMIDLFRSSRSHLAVVQDERKHVMGIVSFEDVLEELVGDIQDEFDIEKGPYYEKKTNSVLVDAELPLRDLALETGWPLPTHSNETVGHWCLARWGKIPTRGDYRKVGHYGITADQVDTRGLRRVRIDYFTPSETEKMNFSTSNE